MLAPHHDVGFTDDKEQQQMEYLHHGDPLTPRIQRFSGYARSLLTGLNIPVHNTWGLRPATVEGTKQIMQPTRFHDLDSAGLLKDVTTLALHPHLPHYELTAPEGPDLRVLGRQLIDQTRPHPFTLAGNTEFNALIHMPPSGDRAGDIVLVDSTHFTTLFGASDSLKSFWRNLVTMRLMGAGMNDLLLRGSNIAVAFFVVSSTLAVGLGWTVGQILTHLKQHSRGGIVPGGELRAGPAGRIRPVAGARPGRPAQDQAAAVRARGRRTAPDQARRVPRRPIWPSRGGPDGAADGGHRGIRAADPADLRLGHRGQPRPDRDVPSWC